MIKMTEEQLNRHVEQTINDSGQKFDSPEDYETCFNMLHDLVKAFVEVINVEKK